MKKKNIIKKEVGLPKSEEIQKEIKPYFLKEINENNEEICSIFNYYYESKGEKDLFGEYVEDKEVNFEGFKFNIEYENKNPWEIIYE